jgi:MFS family permease
MLRLVVAGAIVSAVVGAIRPMVSYRALEQGASAGDLGILASSFALLAIAFALPLGQLADRIGGRVIGLVGACLICIAAATVPWAHGLVALSATQALLGLGQLAVVVSAQVYLAGHGPRAGRAGRFGTYTSMASLGRALGPAIAGLIAGRMSTDVVFLVAAVASVGVLVAAVGLPATRPAADAGSRESEYGQLKAAFGSKGMRAAMIGSIVVLAAGDLLTAYLPAYGIEHGLTHELIGIALAAIAVGEIASRLAMGSLVNRYGHARPMIICMVVAAITIPGLSLDLGPVGLVVLMVVVGAALGLCQPLSLMWVALSAPPSIRGLAMSLRLGANRLGQLVLPASIGAVAVQGGVAAIAWTVSGTLLLGALAVGHQSKSGDLIYEGSD